MTDGDRDLHEVFQASRKAERAGTPPFGRVLQGRPGPGPGWSRGAIRGVLVAGGVVVLVVLGVLLARPPKPDPDLELARRVMAWRSRTDFLLPSDASDLLSVVPRMGEAPAGSPLRALDPGGILGPPIFSRSPRS